MKEEIIIDFGSICRFCLKETDSEITVLDKFLDEKSNDILQDNLLSFVSRISHIKMDYLENFPSLVCKMCYDFINSCYNFSLVCKQSDQSLRECYHRTLNETKAKLHFTKWNENKVVDVANEDDSIWREKPAVKTTTSAISMNACDLSKLDKDEIHGKTRWKPVSNFEEITDAHELGDVKEKYQKLGSLSEKLKETQVKLKEDIVRSNNILNLVQIDNKKILCKDEYHHCPECPKKYSSRDILGLHIIGNNGQFKKVEYVVKYQCQMCTQSFSDRIKLISHYNDVHDQFDLMPDELNCTISKFIEKIKRKFHCSCCMPCNEFPMNREYLLNQVNDKHNEGEFNCPITCNGNKCKPESFPTLVPSDRSAENDQPAIKEGTALKREVIDDLHLRKIFNCTDCSFPVSFTSSDTYLQHRISCHDKQSVTVSSGKRPTTVLADSPEVFKPEKGELPASTLKIFCRACEPRMEFTSTRDFVDHMHSIHNKANLEAWDAENIKLETSAVVSPNEMKKKAENMEKKWKCTECSSAYHRRYSLCHHMKEKHKKLVNFAPAKCPDCEESFFTNRQLIQHGISAHQKYFSHYHKVFKKKFLPSTEVTDCDSGKGEQKQKNFECDICRRKYTCKTSWKRHVLKAHLGKGQRETVSCPHCEKTLASKPNLKSHIEFVHEALFVACPVCKKKINFKTIGKHYKTHEGPNLESESSGNSLLCNLCGKTLKSRKSFEDHQKLHKNIRDQLCDVCGSGFTTKKFLYLHKKTHEGTRRKLFECDKCEKVFSGRHTLNRHLLTHSKEKNFVCEICSKCFYTLQELNRHVRYHKKEYRFDCQLCDMRFLDKSRFRHHMMRHRNVRPHKCQLCDKMFIVKRKMNLHMAAKHNVQVKSTKGVWKDPKTYVPLDDLL